MSDNTPDLDLVSRRIRGLLAKTLENGATEAEALLASAKARELMDRYRLSMSDVQVQAEPIEQVTIDRQNKSQLAAVDYCTSGIAKYCGVKMWFTTLGRTRRIVIFGLRGDVEMARYLYDMLTAVIAAEVKAFDKREKDLRWQAIWNSGGDAQLRDRDGRSARMSFQVGMADRINGRLIQMAADLEPVAKTASGTALVVVKNALVNEAYAKLGLRLKTLTGGPSAHDMAAYGQGQEAGNKVNLGRPVGSRTADRQLN